MQQLKQLYRNNYAGENIISQLTLSGGEWNPTTEYVPNSVTNTHTTSQAVAVGNGESRLGFNLALIQHHHAGMYGADSLQSYACNAAYRDFTPDFLIATGDDIVEEIANSGYCENNIVYTSADKLLKYPNKFYLIPQNIQNDAGSIAAYMACFDGHKKVFLLGYDHYDMTGPYNNVYKNTNGYLTDTDTDNGEYFVKCLRQVIETYSDVDFVRVTPTNSYWLHSHLEPLLNLRQISYNDFAIEADLGVISVA